LEVGLYLSASGATRAAIDTMNGIGFSACYTEVNNFKRKLVNEHPINIRNFFSKHVSVKKKIFFKKLLLIKINYD
jgi:hypothetical protein